MSEKYTKASLLATIEAEHARLEEALASLSKEQMVQSGVAGLWTVKDVLVHLTWWEQDLVRRIETGERLDTRLKEDRMEVDHANARIVEARRATGLAVVLEEFRRS